MMEISEINTRNDLANFLNIPKKQLSYILYIKGINNLYTSFEIPKKSGGIRQIYKPQQELKEIQRNLGQKLLIHKN